jgi:hypothetical protein
VHEQQRNDLEVLKSELDALKHQLDAHRTSRLKLQRRLAVGAVTAAALYGIVAWASTSNTWDCTQGALPLGLNCLLPNTPAVAGEVNYNFKLLGDQINNNAAVSSNADTALAARVTALETRATDLSWKVNGDGGTGVGLVKQPRVQSGFLGPNGCGSTINAPCNVTFPYAFSTTPRCAAMAWTPDTTGYNENPVVASVSQTGLSVWKGQYPGSGVTMTFYWVCVEPPPP